ncbi:hypothetical protein JRO89_XS03G0290100 [Xanthoceras sorbifolium]|uniref:EF-hand domain-containing protein n=1 Tax=Xanthoceras sorbifolium TaxID=99658 RepID=A0ABQ8ID31_9ROSI|nr:hypothetical protein JRO89_XS03G0290100 [Xanthoceras sorbifolium]
MVISLLLLAVLFIAGFINIFFYFPTKKVSAKIQSFFSTSDPSSAVAAPAETSTAQVSSQKGIRSSNTANKTVELRRVFAMFDKNGDGFITKQELGESMKNLRLFVTEKEAEEMVVNVGGEDGDHGREGGLKEAFDVFDQDKDGLISVEELGLVLSSLGLNEGKKIENCKEMIRKVDMDGDGMVNFDEFKKMMKTGGKLLAAF